MIHYLKFYFCTLGNIRPVAFIIMVQTYFLPLTDADHMAMLTIQCYRHCGERLLLP